MKKIITMICVLALSLCAVFGTACGSSSGTKIGAQAGTTGYLYASAIKNVTATGYTSPDLAVKDMENGKLDYVIVDQSTAESLLSDANHKDKVKLVTVKNTDDPIVLTKDVYAIGVDKAQDTLKDQINQVLANKSAEITSILAKSEEDFVVVKSAEKDSAKASTQLVFATSASWPPYESVAGDGFKGYDMEIAKLIADELQMELVIENMEFASVVTSVGKNNVDCAIAALSVTSDRAQIINFTNGYQTADEGQVVLTLKSNTKLDNALTVIDVLNAFLG